MQLQWNLLTPARTSGPELEAALRAVLRVAPGEAELLSAMALEHLDTGGKRLRARLALCAAELWQVPSAAGMAWAVACEVLHNGTLVHDDLQDGDTTRRGAPTVWVRHTPAQAINVGDWLLMRAFAAVDTEALPVAMRWQLTVELRRGLETVIHGQTLECAWRGGQAIAWPQYRLCVRAKTAALFALPVQGAAILAGESPAAAAAARTAFGLVGELFQMVDDVIDLYGDKGRSAPGQDLYEGKHSALVVAHCRRCPSDANWLTTLLQTPRDETPAADVLKARERFVAAGTLADIEQHIDALSAEAEAGCPKPLLPLLTELMKTIKSPMASLQLPATARTL